MMGERPGQAVVNTGLPSLVVTGLALHSFQRDTLYAWLKDTDTARKTAHWVQLPDQGPRTKMCAA